MAEFNPVTYTIVMFCLIIFNANATGEPKDFEQAVWDTVIANIKVIESLEQPDSVKNGLIQDLFEDYQVTANEYRHVYKKLINQPPKQQQQLLKRIKSILQKLISSEKYKKHRRQPRKSSSNKTSDSDSKK